MTAVSPSPFSSGSLSYDGRRTASTSPPASQASSSSPPSPSSSPKAQPAIHAANSSHNSNKNIPANLLLLLVPQIQAKLRRRLSPTDLHRNLGSPTIFLKERIDRLQPNRLPLLCPHLRHLRVRAHLSRKLELVPVQRILPSQRHRRARQRVIQFAECELSAPQHKLPHPLCV